MASKGFDTPEKQPTVVGGNLKKMKIAALKSQKGAYLGCLYLMMADERYTPVKKLLHKGLLADKQQYPRDVLAMKRFMANIIGTAAAKPKGQQQQQPKLEPTGGVTFVQPEKKKKDFPVCHVCGYTHEGGLDNCNHISQPEKLVKNGMFNGVSGNAATTAAARKPTKQKRGTANMVVKEEDNREETEVEGDGMPTREHILQMLGM